MGMRKTLMEEIADNLIEDLKELIPHQLSLDINDNFSDYLAGIIERSQTVLRMMGVPEDEIPNDGSC